MATTRSRLAPRRAASPNDDGRGGFLGRSRLNVPASGIRETVARFVRHAAARVSGPGRPWGGQKVLLAALWDALRGAPEVDGCSWVHFAHWMLEAHRDGLVELARIDLPAGLDDDSAGFERRSEIHDGYASYHAIVAPRTDEPDPEEQPDSAHGSTT